MNRAISNTSSTLPYFRNYNGSPYFNVKYDTIRCSLIDMHSTMMSLRVIARIGLFMGEVLLLLNFIFK